MSAAVPCKWHVMVTDINCSPCRAGNAAAAGGAIIYLIFYLPYYFIIPRYDDLNWSLMMALCIDLVVTMSFGCVQIAAFERSGEPRSVLSLLLM